MLINLTLLKTWAVDFIAEISTQFLSGERIERVVHVRQ